MAAGCGSVYTQAIIGSKEHDSWGSGEGEWSGFGWFGPLTRREVGTRRTTRAVRAEHQGQVRFSTPGGGTAEVPASPWGAQRAETLHRSGWSSRGECHRRTRKGP